MKSLAVFAAVLVMLSGCAASPNYSNELLNGYFGAQSEACALASSREVEVLSTLVSSKSPYLEISNESKSLATIAVGDVGARDISSKSAEAVKLVEDMAQINAAVDPAAFPLAPSSFGRMNQSERAEFIRSEWLKPSNLWPGHIARYKENRAHYLTQCALAMAATLGE